MVNDNVTIIGPGQMAVLPLEELRNLAKFKDRAEIKLRQLESTKFEDFGGLGTGKDKDDRMAYIRLLRWLLNLPTVVTTMKSHYSTWDDFLVACKECKLDPDRSFAATYNAEGTIAGTFKYDRGGGSVEYKSF